MPASPPMPTCAPVSTLGYFGLFLPPPEEGAAIKAVLYEVWESPLPQDQTFTSLLEAHTLQAECSLQTYLRKEGNRWKETTLHFLEYPNEQRAIYGAILCDRSQEVLEAEGALSLLYAAFDQALADFWATRPAPSNPS